MPDQQPAKATTGPFTVEGAIDAPVIYFDEAPVFGLNPTGVPSILLCTLVQDIDENGQPLLHKKVVAQLRGSLLAFQGLLRDLQQIEALLTRPDTPAN